MQRKTLPPSERGRRAIELIKNNPAITDRELADVFGVCVKTVKNTLYRMRRAGIEIPYRGSRMARRDARAREIGDAIVDNPHITNAELAERFGISRDYVRWLIARARVIGYNLPDRSADRDELARAVAAVIIENPLLTNAELAARFQMKLSYVRNMVRRARRLGCKLPRRSPCARAATPEIFARITEAINATRAEGRALTIARIAYAADANVGVVQIVFSELGIKATGVYDDDDAICRGTLERDDYWLEQVIQVGGWPGFSFAGDYWRRYRRIYELKRRSTVNQPLNPARVDVLPPRDQVPQLSTMWDVR